MLIALAAPLGAGLFFLLSTLVQPARLRGIAVALTVTALCLFWSRTSPQSVKDATIAASLLFLALTALSPRAHASIRTSISPLIPLTALFFGCALATTQLTNPEGVGFLLRLVGLSLLLITVVGQFTRDDIASLRRGLIANGAIQVALGLIELLITHRPVLWGYLIYGNGRGLNNENHLLGDAVSRVQGSLGHPIPFSVVITIALVLLLVEWKTFSRPWALLLLALFAASLILSGSRSGILAAVLGVAHVLLNGKTLSSRWRGLLAVAAGAAAIALNADSVGAIVGELVDSGSFSNRQGNLSYVPALLARPPWESLWGSGAATQQLLFDRGLLLNNGLNVVDNQLVTTLATQGVVGLLLLVLLVLVGWRATDAAGRAAILPMVVMLFSFDYLAFASMVSILIVCLAMPRVETVLTADDRACEEGQQASKPMAKMRNINRETTQAISI